MAVTDLVGVHSLNDVREKLLNNVWDTWVDPAVMVEDVFSTALYTGNGAAQTVTTGIDLTGTGTGNLMQGGLTWIKTRSVVASNMLLDTVRGGGNVLMTNTTGGNATNFPVSFNFTSTGFSHNTGFTEFNGTGYTYAAWTFRKANKFFDSVTYTGNGSSRSIAHSLGTAPGMIVIKRTDNTSNWSVYNIGTGINSTYLNTTAAASALAHWGSMTETTFGITGSAEVNTNGGTYVAYIFAHDASADGIIQCGGFTTDSSGNATINLGWEPGWLLFKASSSAVSGWGIADEIRGWTADSGLQSLSPNTNAAESAGNATLRRNATGFTINGSTANTTYIYCAIRKGPMRVPTDATKVFIPVYRQGNPVAAQSVNVGMQVDALFSKGTTYAYPWAVFDRLRGNTKVLSTNDTVAEATDNSSVTAFTQTGVDFGISQATNASGYYVQYLFKRAPGFFDVVCYTGDSSASTRYIAHNLKVRPDLIIIKSRSAASNWMVSHVSDVNNLRLNTADSIAGIFDPIAISSSGASTFAISPISSGSDLANTSGATYVAYLFASCPGVSKAFSYIGNGTNQTINLGFQPRFIMIKRIDTTGDWFVWDTAHGISDSVEIPLSLNSSSAEGSGYDSVDRVSTGFVANQTTNNINVSTATYIGYAIA